LIRPHKTPTLSHTGPVAGVKCKWRRQSKWSPHTTSALSWQKCFTDSMKLVWKPCKRPWNLCQKLLCSEALVTLAVVIEIETCCRV